MIRATRQVTSWRMRPVLSAAAAAALLLAGCPDARSPIAPEVENPTAEGNPPLPGLIVSESRALPGTAATAASAESGVAYVSVAPGTLQGAMSVRIRNVTAEALPLDPVPVIDGGFDPVIVPASPGDRIALAVRQSDGTITHVTFVVPVKRPPVVVRTNPPKGRTDVALSIRPLVVFSEPIDPQSLGPTAVQLLGGSTPVSGTILMVEGSPFMAEFIPDAPLNPLADYELIVTTAVRDFQSDALAQELRVAFTTGTDAGAAGLRVSNTSTGGAFDINGYQVLVMQHGQHVRTAALELNTATSLTGLDSGEVSVELTNVADNCAVNGGATRTIQLSGFLTDQEVAFDVHCTPPPELASIRLIFSRWDGVSSAKLFAMNADGSNVQQLTTGFGFDLGPVVSPDGSRIAFSRETEGFGFWGRYEVHVMDVSGANLARVTQDPANLPTIAWDWSPDGTRLAIVTLYEHIALINADGSGYQSLVNSGGGGNSPAWSPDGRTIVFSRYVRPVGEFTCDNPTGGYEIWAIDVDGGNPRRLKRLSECFGPGAHLSWLPDGSGIVYSDLDADRRPALWRMSVDGSSTARLVAPNALALDFGVWSPDRSMITMTRSYSVPDWRIDLYLLRVADGSLVRVTADGLSTGATFSR